MIKWITESLGTGAYDSVIKQNDINIVDVRDLVDKKGNTSESIREKIKETLSYLNRGEKVVICCDYGMSRSNAIAAGVLSNLSNISYDNAIKKVMEITKEKSIKIEVISIVKEALEGYKYSIKNSKNHILITGGTGKLGRFLVPKLKENNEVFAPPHSLIDLTKGSVDLDLFVKENNIDIIIHLANPHIYNNNQSMGESLVMLKNVIDVCKVNKVKLVYISSWEIYSGYNSESLLASENLPPFPRGVYGETKYLCENLIKLYEHDIDCVIIRSSPIYGIGDRPKFIYNFIEKNLCDKDIITHKYINGFPHIDLLYIDDAISAIVCIVNSNMNGIFNIGSGKGTSTTEIANIIKNILNSRSNIKHREISEYYPNIVIDTTKIQKLFGWSPNVDIKEGLIRILSEYKKE